MSHARRADRLLIKANSGRQAGVAVHTRTIHSQDTHDAVRRLMSHEQHDDNKPGNGP
jgi:hypothetical protein